MRNFIIITTCLLCSIMCFVNCVGDNRIRVLGENSSNLQAMNSLKEVFEQQNNIKIDFRPNTFEDTSIKANQDFSNHSALYDIILQVNFSLSSFVGNNWVVPHKELINLLDPSKRESLSTLEQDIFEEAWKEVGYYSETGDLKDMKCIGYPFATNTMLLVYNKKMFSDEYYKNRYYDTYGEVLSTPDNWSWEQLRRAASIFTDKNKGDYGICMQGDNAWLYYEYCVFLYGNGGKIFNKRYGWQGDETTEILINNEDARLATEFYLSMKPYNKGNFQDVGAERQIELLKQGNVAMAIVWSDYLDCFKDEYDKFGFAPLPGGKSPLAGGCFYVNNDSHKKADAINYIFSLLQPDMQIKLAQKGLCSPFKSTYEDESVKRIPYSSALKKSLENGTYMFEASPECVIVMDIIAKYILRLWNGEIDVEQALTQIYNEIKKERVAVYKKIKE